MTGPVMFSWIHPSKTVSASPCSVPVIIVKQVVKGPLHSLSMLFTAPNFPLYTPQLFRLLAVKQVVKGLLYSLSMSFTAPNFPLYTPQLFPDSCTWGSGDGDPVQGPGRHTS